MIEQRMRRFRRFGAAVVVLVAALVVAPAVHSSSDVRGTVSEFTTPGGAK
jgi:hypothetical protein